MMRFSLSDSIYKHNMTLLNKQTEILSEIGNAAGTGNPKFDNAWAKLVRHLKNDSFSTYRMEDRFDIRAIAVALNSEKSLRKRLIISKSLLDDVTRLLNKGSLLFNDALYQYYLTDFDEIEEKDGVGKWLQNSRLRMGTKLQYDRFILCSTGPKTLANDAIKNNISFDAQLEIGGLEKFASGQFLRNAQAIYYLAQLKRIPVNEPHELLEEVQLRQVYESKYDDHDLIGHRVLNILLSRAPKANVHESWQNTIIAIAGDPRIPKSHSRYLKWWSHVPEESINKVRGWLSKLDLKLFLDALEDFSNSSLDTEMKRMFPSRKRFLEGMHEAGAIIHTKLYLSKKADRYIRRNYDLKHIPEYSLVVDGDRSIIYATLTDGHMVEGSHNCKIWFYKSLHETAPMMQYGAQRKYYRDLTGGLSVKMARLGHETAASFTHSPANYNWQDKSIRVLQEMGVKIRASDVLINEDYKKYKRIYGVR